MNITNEGLYISIDTGNNNKFHLKKGHAFLYRSGNNFFYSSSEGVPLISFNETEVVTPAHADADALETALLNIGIGAYSVAALAVIDRMSGLSIREKNAISTFVDADIAAGNWDNRDEFICPHLSGANALLGWKGRFNATNTDGVITVDGVALNGSSAFVNTNYNANVDAINFALNDAHVSVFVVKYDGSIIQQKCLYGSGTQTYLVKFASTNFEARLNGGGKIIADNFYSGNLYVSERSAAGSYQVYESGVKIIDELDAAGGIDNADILVGKLLTGSFFNGTVGSISYGGSLGDKTVDYDNQLSLAVSLGATVPTVDLVTAYDGNSLTDGTGASTVDYYPKEVTNSLFVDTKSNSANYFGVGSRPLVDCITNALIDTDPVVVSGNTNISICWEDVNDIANGKTGLQNYNNMVTFFNDRKTAGFQYGVLVLGYYLRTPFGGTWTTAKENEQEDFFNRVLAADLSTVPWDAVVDLRDAPNIGGAKGQAINATYFSDYVHLTDAGYDIVAEKVYDAIKTLIS